MLAIEADVTDARAIDTGTVLKTPGITHAVLTSLACPSALTHAAIVGVTRAMLATVQAALFNVTPVARESREADARAAHGIEGAMA